MPQGPVQAKEGFLRDLFGQLGWAPKCAQISEYRVAQFYEPSLDFFPKLGRAGIWRRDSLCLLPGGSTLCNSLPPLTPTCETATAAGLPKH